MSGEETRRPGARRISDNELELMIDAILTDHLAYLKTFLSEKPRYDGKTFETEIAGFLSVTLADQGYCWARIPADHDDLWHGIQSSASATGRVNRLAMVSDNSAVRRSAARTFSMKVTSHWLETRTSVVKRKIS